jgi:dTDP-glucose 4,6-dehydratase
MRIVVTGGAGFIGSHLCDRLIDRNHDVVCVDNLSTGREDNVAHLFGDPKFHFMHYDVTEYLYIKGALDFVIHLAALPSPVDYFQYPIQTLKVGSLGTHKTLGLAKAKGAGYLLASTSEVYGDPTVHPQKEDYRGNVNPIGPRSAYDESKRFAEALTMAYNRIHGIPTRIARIFNTYGPRMRVNDGRVLPSFMASALRGEDIIVHGDGTQTRSFCYVSDLVEGLCRLMDSDERMPINLGNPGEITILQFAEEIIEVTGSESKITFEENPIGDDPMRRRPDISRAKELLGWEPDISRGEGLRKTLEYFKKELSGL